MELSMGFWILLILCTVLFFLIGFYILRMQQVEGFQTAPTFLDIRSTLPEVFLGVGVQNDTGTGATLVKALDNAAAYCRTLGAQLATYEQLGAASRLGARWTIGGFLLNRQTLFFPCDSNIDYVCSSIATTGPAICYGVKPSGTTYTNFNTSLRSQWTEFPATATTGLAEVFLLTTGSDIASQTAATAACTGLGKSIRLATLGELQVAQQSGLHFCQPGWTSSDTTHVFNPVSYYESAVCNGNGVIQYDNGNIPTSGGIVWFDASILTEETIKGGSIPSLFTGTSAVAVTVTGTPTLVESPVSNRNVLSLTASPVQSLTTRAFTTALTSWTLAFVARQTGGLKQRVFQGISKNNVFGYHDNRKQAFYMGDAASTSPWISPITTTSAVSATQSTTPASDTAWDIVLITCTSTTTSATITINWNGVQTPSISMGVPIGFDGIAVNTGIASSQTSDCEIAEFIVYNTALGTTDQTTILAYLNEKWITPLTSAEQSLIKNYAPQNFGATNQRGAICMGPKPFPMWMSNDYVGNIGVNSNFPLDAFNTYTPYQTLATNSSIQPFNRDIFSQRYTISQYTSTTMVPAKEVAETADIKAYTDPAHPSTQYYSEFKQQCSYLSTLNTITGRGFWLCDSDNAAKYLMSDPSVGPYDQICVFVGDHSHTQYSCKDRTKSGKNADMIRYQSVDDLNTFCENTARLYMDLSGGYSSQYGESIVYISTISTMSSMQGMLNKKLQDNCPSGTTNLNCGNIILASTQVGNSISTLTKEFSVLGGISSVSTIMSTVRAARTSFQCYNYGV